MKKLFLIAFIIFSLSSYAQTQLSDKAHISVITCGPWQGELYSAFGHSAFRIYDPVNNIDEAYNYGVFDFDQPNFYLNFARGYLYYKLGVYDYQSFQDYYVYHNRFIHEQVLNFSQAQKQKLNDYLLWNSQPENQYYRYDYFYNNCATKIRDVVATVFKDSINFDGSYVKEPASFRKLADKYLIHQPWGDLGIDIGLGLPMDKVASPYEHMYLPDYIESGFNHATIVRGGQKLPIVKETIKVYETRAEDLPPTLPHPLYILSGIAILILALSAYDLKRKKIARWLDIILFGVAGFLGVSLSLLWFATDHHAAAKNFNLLWALPTHVVVAFALVKNASWIKNYFLGVTILTGVLLLSWVILPQALNVSLIPVVIALGVRAFVEFYLRKAAQPEIAK